MVVLHIFIFLVIPTGTITTTREKTITEQKVVASAKVSKVPTVTTVYGSNAPVSTGVASSTTGSLAYDGKWHYQLNVRFAFFIWQVNKQNLIKWFTEAYF